MPHATAQTYSISDKICNSGDVVADLEALRAAGFEYIHFSTRWFQDAPMEEAEIKLWEQALAQTGIKVLDVHGTLTPKVNLWVDDPDRRALAFELLLHRLEVTHRLGGDAIVYHAPNTIEPSEQVYRYLVDGLARAEETARDLGIRIALENHYDAELTNRSLEICFERFEPDYLGLTLDPGHANLAGNLEWLCRNCHDRLMVLHLNDNDGARDRHWLPQDQRGTIDWDLVVECIAKSPYNKPLQLEVIPLPGSSAPDAGYLREARATLDDLQRRITQARQKDSSPTD